MLRQCLVEMETVWNPDPGSSPNIDIRLIKISKHPVRTSSQKATGRIQLASPG